MGQGGVEPLYASLSLSLTFGTSSIMANSLLKYIAGATMPALSA